MSITKSLAALVLALTLSLGAHASDIQRLDDGIYDDFAVALPAAEQADSVPDDCITATYPRQEVAEHDDCISQRYPEVLRDKCIDASEG